MDAAELRILLDSLEVEKQTLKRQGKPIDHLEAKTAELRDSILAVREQSAGTAPSGGAEKPGFLATLGLPDGWASFRPSGVMDWVIVGTGAVALLSALMLAIGVVAGLRKRKTTRKAAKADKAPVRKINLTPPTGVHKAQAPGDGGVNTFGTPGGNSGENLQSLIDHLRNLTPEAPRPDVKGTPPPPFVNTPSQAAGDTVAYAPPRANTGYAPPANDAPTVKTAPEPTQPPPELIITAPDPIPLPPPTPGATLNELIVQASNSGLSDTDISKRFQVSVDQVKLILRMSRQ